MSSGLRKAKAGTEFLIHPTSRGREQLPERVTSEILQRQSDELAKMDERVVDLFHDRTQFARSFFENEKATEETLCAAEAIECGVLHELEGSTPRCDPAWPETMRRLEKETGWIFPVWTKTAAYGEACRCAALFADKKAERVDVAPTSLTPRLVIVAN
jgi:hypothetical protein